MLENYNEIMTEKDIAELLGVSVLQVQKLAQKGEIPYIRVGRFYRFPKEDFINHVLKNKNL